MTMPSDPPPSGHESPAARPRRRFARLRVLATVLIVIAVVVAGLAGGGLFVLHRLWTEPGPLRAESTVIVPRGASGREIAAVLAEAEAVADPRLFLLSLRLIAPDRPLKAGEYRFPAAISLRDVVAKLQDGDTVIRRLTVPEGLTTAEIVALVEAAPGLSGPVPERDLLGEGTLLPETYHYSWGDSRAGVLARMLDSMRAAVDRLWAGRAEGLPIATREEAVILASIVERETGVAAERPRVAAVFVNRLNRGMRLQSDPTVAYGVSNGQGLDRPLTRSDLDTEHPWNTYLHAGLPPTPIANPGLASLSATLNPAEGDELYFVADGTGGHAFARTLAEHNRNVARWRRIERERRAGD